MSSLLEAIRWGDLVIAVAVAVLFNAALAFGEGLRR